MREPVLAHDAVLTAALTYAAHGWPVFPCNPLNKHPLTEHGFQNATTNEGQIRASWAMWPQANVAFPTGSVSGIDVLDVDADHGGFESLACSNNASPNGRPRYVSAQVAAVAISFSDTWSIVGTLRSSTA